MWPAVETSHTAKTTQQFGFLLLSQLVSAGHQSNTLISPISISLCLQLALYGARGHTAEEMHRVLGVSQSDREVLADDAKFLTKRLQAVPMHLSFEGPGASVSLALANSIWVQNTVRLASDYEDGIRSKYTAACTSLDFGDPQSLLTINSWVDQNTAHKIPRIIDQLQPDNMLVLINCAYFKARWSQQFLPQHTSMREFNLLNHTAVPVPTMHMKGASLSYFQDQTVQVAMLDYTDQRFGMCVILPARGADLSQFVSELTADLFKSWLSKMSEHQGFFALPKFKHEYAVELNDSLKQLGMVEAFTGGADFFNMFAAEQKLPPLFCIDRVIHKTFIDVDEQGTEAAAATAVQCWGAGISEPPPPFQMVVDRPFIYAVCEGTTGTILFLGIVIDPRN